MAYSMPATMICVLHHTADAPKVFRDRKVLKSNAIFILEFANKLNIKSIMRYFFGKQKWSPFTLEPVEFVRLNYDFHPKTICNWLRESDFVLEKTLTLMHFRLELLKRIIPTAVLVFLDLLFQWTGTRWQLTPSVMMR